MSKRTEFVFNFYIECEDGKIANINTGDLSLNVFIDNYDEIEVSEQGKYAMCIEGVSDKISVWKNSEEYSASDPKMAETAMIPIGTFPPEPGRDFKPSPYILFSGKVIEVDKDPDSEDSEPNYCMTVETYGISFNLFVRYDGVIEKGYIIHGVAWLYGNIEEI